MYSLPTFFNIWILLPLKDQPQGRVVGEIGSDPVDENEEPVLHSHQQQQVQSHPHKPGEESLEPDVWKIHHCLVFSYGGQ